MSQMVAGKECVMGVDVSRWQGNINWSAFDKDFAIIKATGGDGGLYVDGMFATNMRNCTKPRGAYHFASLAAYGAVQEADYFCNVLLNSEWANLPASHKLPPVLDWEPTRAVANSGQWVLAFLKQVEKRTGIRPVIYTGAYVALDRVLELLNYDLWLAAYTQSPPLCAPWGKNWSIWQYTSSGHAGGIAGGVDSNAATVEWFNRVTQGGTSPSQPTPIEEDIMASLQEMTAAINAAIAPLNQKIDELNARVANLEARDADGMWMGTDDRPEVNAVYTVSHGVKRHVPGDLANDLDTLVLAGYDNRGVQSKLLSVLPEDPYDATK